MGTKQCIATLLERPLAVHRVFCKIAGGLPAGVMLSQAYYWCDKGEDPDWFWKTQAEWQEETMLTRREQETARRDLRQLRTPAGAPVWEEERRGQPPRLYFRLNLDALMEVIESFQYGGKRHSSMAENAILEWRKAPIRNGGKRQSILYSTKNTTETTTGGAVAPAPEPPAPVVVPPEPVTAALDGEPLPVEPEAPTTTKTLAKHPAVTIYRDTFLAFPSRAQMHQIVQAGVTDLEQWQQVTRTWLGRGYNPRNIGGMLEWYGDPTRMAIGGPSTSSGHRQNGHRAAPQPATNWDDYARPVPNPERDALIDAMEITF